MERTGNLEAIREEMRARANRMELVERLTRLLPEDGWLEPLKGVAFIRASAPKGPIHGTFSPAFCVIAQGAKVGMAGEHTYRYDPGHYLLTTVEWPVVSQVVEATKDEPYLSIRMELEAALVSSVMIEAGGPASRNGGDVSAFAVSPLDAELLDAVVRLVRLADSPGEARVLTPLVTREIVYRLLVGEQGQRLPHVAVLGGQSHRIARAVAMLRRDFDKPLRIEEIAERLGMSGSGFHHHFKGVTGMSPLQFQKQLRLQEARRLMLVENLDAATAGYRVGYDDASHFNREYKKLFGEPPRRNVERLREQAGSE